MCTYDDCEKPIRSARSPYCEGHYYQLRRGVPLSPLRPIRKRAEHPWCDMEGCGKRRVSGAYCAMHEARIRRHGSPHKVIEPSERRKLIGPDNPTWSDTPTYHAVHDRLASQRGSAKQHTCPCGSPARQWAFTGPREPGERLPYSADLSLYVAMCVPCHKAMDLASLDGVPVAPRSMTGGA